MICTRDAITACPCGANTPIVVFHASVICVLEAPAQRNSQIIIDDRRPALSRHVVQSCISSPDNGPVFNVRPFRLLLISSL